jgi:GntR family transcriptional regulator, transcriptional repressor for pyruvate dehydrogenase complex
MTRTRLNSSDIEPIPLRPVESSRAANISILQSKIRPVSRTTVSDEVVEQIMALISNGDLKPGQRLPSERELCKTFHAGRSSLREAIRGLCILGILKARVGDGTSVSDDGKKFLGRIVEWRLITEQHDIENLMSVRTALEGLAVADAARKADAEFMALMRHLITRMEAAVNTVNHKLFVQLDLEFHVAIARAAQNDLLFDFVTMIRSQLMRALSRVAAHPYALPRSLKEHGLIVRAIENRNPKSAAAAMQQHLENSLKRYRTAARVVPADPAPKAARKIQTKSRIQVRS